MGWKWWKNYTSIKDEIPYDVPNQSEFMSNNGKVNGFASLKWEIMY